MKSGESGHHFADNIFAKILFLYFDSTFDSIFYILQMALSMRSLCDANDGENESVCQVYTNVGMYKGNMVAIQKLDTGPINLMRDHLLELKAVTYTGIGITAWIVITPM